MKINPKKVLLLGSGALKIGEAGEFDYSGSQAIKALREEGIKTILINPNIATVQTSEGLADKIYFLPVKPNFVTEVIKKEKPDGLLLSFGGQTALNCGVELYRSGVLKKHHVKILGTPIQTIINSEDRKLFVKVLNQIKVKTPRSLAVTSITAALKAAKKIKYPVMLRIAYALGGKGSGLVRNSQELTAAAKKAFSYSRQILIEEYLNGWKEVEYEVVRDKDDNCITVCNMENFDPLGIHTGESIVVAPSQTLTNHEYHKLRELSIRIIRKLGVIGECNVQFALDPHSDDYRVIEVNARLSRSSALASKATGYPLAFIAAKLALGYNLIELENSITKVTKACFEPALDYVVVKIPRWDLKKFKRVSKYIDSSMKSVGEVMAIGRSFEETLQKAIRMLQVGMYGLAANKTSFENLRQEIKNPTDEWIFAIAEALEKGISIEEIYALSGIDKWFLYKIQNIVNLETQLRKTKKLTPEALKTAKQKGFSDKQLEILTGQTEEKIKTMRDKWHLHPVIKQIDTLGAEYPAKTNYLYLTYNGSENDIKINDQKNNVIVLGSGSYSIGSSVEFDWCCVNAVQTLNQLGYNTVMINYNPETVSTDYDVCDRLYFDELSFETVSEIYRQENPRGLIVSTGGQIPNNLALKCRRSGLNILGTSPDSIDQAENRKKFSKILDSLGVKQPPWKALTNLAEAKKFAQTVEYPVLIRPSYVLSGAAMSVAFNQKELEHFIKKATAISQEYPVVISKFILDAKEIEIDAVASQGKIVTSAISEHVENAGVHSGDATLVLPPQRTYLETIKKIRKTAAQIADQLKITGPFNIQFLAKNNEISVIECNLRASRSFPFVSKVSQINFIELAVKAMLGLKIQNGKTTLDLSHVGVKAPQFSFTRLKGADPVLGVEMASTGEVGCLGDDFEEAFLKSLLAVGYNLPKKNILLSTGPIKSKVDFLPQARLLLKMEFRLFATPGTAKFLKKHDLVATELNWPLAKKRPNILDYLEQKKIDLVVNIPKNFQEEELTNGYLIRRQAADYDIPLITNIQLAQRLVEAIAKKRFKDLKIKAWSEYN